MYERKTWQFKNAIERMEYHTARYGAPGQKRTKRKKPTPEQMEKQNQRNREQKARHRLRKYFDVNDYFSTWTCRKEERPPDMEAAKAMFAKAIKKVRKEYKKRGHGLRWMRNIEVGTKNAWHIHVVINRIPDTDLILQEAWPYGGVSNKLLYQRGEFAALAAYITKTPKTDQRLREASYSISRNLPIPEPKKEIMRRPTWKSDPKPPKGWYLDKDSMEEGENPVTRYPYRRYTFLRILRE